MIEMRHSVTIRRPVQEVFDYVRDQRNESKWHTDVVASEHSGPVEEGDIVTWTVRFMGKRQYVSEVTKVEEPRLIQLKAIRGPMLPTLTHSFSSEDAATTYTRQVRIPPRGFFRLIGPIMKATGAADRRNANFAENLKQLIETNSGSSDQMSER